MRRLLIHLCAVMALTSCEGAFVSAAHGQTQKNRKLDLLSSFAYETTDNLAAPKFYLYTHEDDSVGVQIPLPPQAQPSSFVCDANGLGEHLKHCCYGPKPVGYFEIQHMYNQQGGLEIIIFCHVPECRAPFYKSNKSFTLDAHSTKLQYDENNGGRIYSSHRSWDIAYFRNPLMQLDTLTYFVDYDLDPVYREVTMVKGKEQCSLRDLFDVESMERDRCCNFPEIASVLICNSTTTEDSQHLGNRNLGELNSFTIRYYLHYRRFSPRPACHDKYQKAFYIDMVYNSQTRSFDREEVPFDPEKHKEVPLQN